MKTIQLYTTVNYNINLEGTETGNHTNNIKSIW